MRVAYVAVSSATAGSMTRRKSSCHRRRCGRQRLRKAVERGFPRSRSSADPPTLLRPRLSRVYSRPPRRASLRAAGSNDSFRICTMKIYIDGARSARARSSIHAHLARAGWCSLEGNSKRLTFYRSRESAGPVLSGDAHSPVDTLRTGEVHSNDRAHRDRDRDSHRSTLRENRFIKVSEPRQANGLRYFSSVCSINGRAPPREIRRTQKKRVDCRSTCYFGRFTGHAIGCSTTSATVRR